MNNRVNFSFGLLCVVLVITVMAGCRRENAETAPPYDDDSPAVTVAVVNYPLAYFVERIAGNKVRILFPVPQDCDPAFWKPTDDQIQQYQQADLILLNGAGYAKWIKTSSLPESKVVNTSKAFSDKYLQNKHGVTHSHGPQGADTHGAVDFNIWLDPLQALQQAESVRDALIRLMPQSEVSLPAGYISLSNDLKDLDKRLREFTDRIGSQPIMASHPVYNYLSRRYKWNLKSVHWEPGEMPSDHEWQRFAEILKTHPAKIMIWEADPAPEVAEKVHALGLRCLTFNPCGNRPAVGDYLSVMRDNTDDKR